MSNFTSKDIVRVMSKVQEDYNRVIANPIASKAIKDFAITVWWPAVYKYFYPEGITFEQALQEVRLLDTFKNIWSQTTVGLIMDIIEEAFDLSSEKWNRIRTILIELLAVFIQKLL